MVDQPVFFFLLHKDHPDARTERTMRVKVTGHKVVGSIRVRPAEEREQPFDLDRFLRPIGTRGYSRLDADSQRRQAVQRPIPRKRGIDDRLLLDVARFHRLPFNPISQQF